MPDPAAPREGFDTGDGFLQVTVIPQYPEIGAGDDPTYNPPRPVDPPAGMQARRIQFAMSG